MSYNYSEEQHRQIEQKIYKIMMESLAEQRKADRATFLTLLGQFPPYHGPGYNYAKQEVEDWLVKAKAIFTPKNTEAGQNAKL